MSITKVGDDNAQDGLVVNGPLKIRNAAGTSVTVITGEGKLVESAGIEIANGDTFDDTNGNEALEFTVTASAVNHLGVVNSATGNNPILRAEGEADTGITFDNSEGEEILILDSVATSVNEVTIRSAATGNKPIIAATGEADTGLEFHNDQAEEMLILVPTATAVNEVTITSAATGNDPVISATGDDADVTLGLTAKGTGGIQVNSPLTVVQGISVTASTRTPDAVSGANAIISPGVTAVDVAAVTNDANDWITLPSLAGVPVGHTITILCNAGTGFELRTPASSTEEINSENCDGTKEYLCTDTQVIKVIKISNTIGWMAHAFSAIGTAVAAVVPDA